MTRKPIGLAVPHRRVKRDTEVMRPFVIVSPQGLAHVGLYENESQAWRIFLGWPTVGEVREHIDKGWYCTEATLTWQNPKESKK